MKKYKVYFYCQFMFDPYRSIPVEAHICIVSYQIQKTGNKNDLQNKIISSSQNAACNAMQAKCKTELN